MHRIATVAVAQRPEPVAQRPEPVAQPLEAATVPDALLSIATTCALTALSSPTIYRLAAHDPTFPKLIKLGRHTRIRAGDLTQWLANRVEAATQGAHELATGRTAKSKRAEVVA